MWLKHTVSSLKVSAGLESTNRLELKFWSSPSFRSQSVHTLERYGLTADLKISNDALRCSSSGREFQRFAPATTQNQRSPNLLLVEITESFKSRNRLILYCTNYPSLIKQELTNRKEQAAKKNYIQEHFNFKLFVPE